MSLSSIFKSLKNISKIRLVVERKTIEKEENFDDIPLMPIVLLNSNHKREQKFDMKGHCLHVNRNLTSSRCYQTILEGSPETIIENIYTCKHCGEKEKHQHFQLTFNDTCGC